MALTQWSKTRYGNDVYGRPVYLDKRSTLMLDEAARLAKVGRLPIAQGGWMGGAVAASAGAHDRLGVVDISVSRLRALGLTVEQVVALLRRVGFAAWHRTSDQGPWPEHIHAVALGAKGLPLVAANQALAYIAGYNGLGHLGHGGPDDSPRPQVIRTWEQYQHWRDHVVSLRDLQAAAAHDPDRLRGLHPRQVRIVQRALGMKVPSGRWRVGTRRRYAATFPARAPKGYPTHGTLQALANAHHFTVE